MKGFEEPIYVTKSFLPPMDEYIQKIKSIWKTHWLTNNGPLHNELEKSLANYLKVSNSTLFTNGHSALDIAIKLLGLTGEVITTPFTFASTTHAIVTNNLTPIFCDINMDDFTINTNKIEKLITEKTSAIIPVHVFGYPCNINEIEKIADKYNLKVIYDAAHAFGVEIEEKGIGNFGDISMFSLHATKVYNSVEGGLLTYKNNDFVKRLNMLKNFGITGVETVESIGVNAKMNEFQAAMGLINLQYINEQISKRKVITNIYRESLKEITGVSYLNDKEGIKHNYSYFPIVIDESITGITRNDLYEKLKEYNIFSRKYFYPLVTEFDCYRDRYDCINLENAKYLSERVLTIPIYGELTVEDSYKIGEVIKEIIVKGK